jgi:hypothetical protein
VHSSIDSFRTSLENGKIAPREVPCAYYWMHIEVGRILRGVAASNREDTTPRERGLTR